MLTGTRNRRSTSHLPVRVYGSSTAEGKGESKGRQGSSDQPAAGPAAAPSSGILCPSEVFSMLLLISSHLYTVVTLLGKAVSKAAVPALTVMPGVPLGSLLLSRPRELLAAKLSWW